jgi:hypothetical protein
MWVGLALFDPNETLLDGLYGMPTVEIGSRTLPSSGVYTLVAYEGYDGQNVGGYCLYLQRLNKPAGAVPIAYGQALTGSITSEAQMDTYSLTGKAGDRVTVRMEKLTGIMWAGVRIYAPSGALLAEQRSPLVAEMAGFELPAAGTYTVLAFDGWYGFRLGTYGLSVLRD